METGILERKIAKLPENLKLKAEGYIDALLDEAKLTSINPDAEKIANRGYGSLKGKIWMADDFDAPSDLKEKLPREFGSLKGFITYMADDFDAPLEDFKDYM